MRTIAHKIARTDFARAAVEENADLSLFMEKPSARIIFGIVLIGFSYIIGWPAVAFFGFLSVYFSQPLIFIVGGPAIYGISHLVFILGIYLAGAQYTYVFFRWAARRFMEKYSGDDVEKRSDEGVP
ncbi:MAG: hypothetical protein A2176_02275 [Spirochaetes bacterium RBG_13_51_14]|nr:MAG: hypothetical protein A2176_02275 [Spirochaetes bacterium RBG_13_51_14]